MKRLLTLSLFAFFVFSASAYAPNTLERPADTNLEFWIAENVDDVDFSGHESKYGIMGGYEYYGMGYAPTIDKTGWQADPQYCVIYTVTSYPDYSDTAQHITSISITDPSVTVYGLTVDSSFAEFDDVMRGNGFTIEAVNENLHRAVNGKFIFSLSEGHLLLRVEVSNKWGIQF